MNLVNLCVIGLASILAACATVTQPYRISDAQTVKVIEGTIVFVDLKRVPIKNNPDISTKDVAVTGASAQNIGNHGVQKSLLFLDVLDDLTAQKFMNRLELRVLDKNSNKEELIVMPNASGNLKNFEVGDTVRVIYRGEKDRFIANLTKSHELDKLTR